MECKELIERYLSTLKEGFKCISTDKRLRVITPYLYPDNDLIEIYIEELTRERVKVTDLGETLRHLHSEGFDVYSSPKRRFLAETIANRVGVEMIKGQLSKLGEAKSVGEIVFDLIVAARGVADLIYTSKAYEPATFFDEVKSFLEENKFHLEVKTRLIGVSKKPYNPDFKIINGKIASIAYLQTVSPKTTMGIKRKVDATFRMWSDCNGGLRKISLLNDVDFQWNEPDVFILKKVSRVDFWSQRDELVSYLRSPSRG